MDTRNLFVRHTSRKPCTWSEVRSLEYYTSDMIAALLDKGRIYVEGHVKPFDEIFPVVNEDYRCIGDLEYILVRELHDENINGITEAYYINTEGYAYGRHMARLSPEIMRLLKIEGRY